MQAILFFVFWIFLTLVCFAGVYYARLLFFHKKNLYRREEIVAIFPKLVQEISRVASSQNMPLIWLGGFVVSSVVAWGFHSIGGIFSESTGEASFANYFFSIPFLALASFFLAETFTQALPFPLNKHWNSVVTGFAIGGFAANLSSFGTHFQMSFVWILFLGIVVMTTLCFGLNGIPLFGIILPGISEPEPDTDNEEEFGTQKEAYLNKRYADAEDFSEPVSSSQMSSSRLGSGATAASEPFAENFSAENKSESFGDDFFPGAEPLSFEAGDLAPEDENFPSDDLVSYDEFS